MAGATSKPTNSAGVRKRVEAETSSLKRAKDGSAFTRCEECNKDVPVVLIDMHNCSLDSKIKMNLESKVVEKPTEAKKPSSTRKKGVSSEAKVKKNKKVKDPNAPKRPVSAFLVFMDDFRKEYKAANPDSKGVTSAAKEGGEKWKSMSDEEKKPYIDKAAELKAEYVKATEKYDEEGAENDNKENEEPEKENNEELEKDDD